LEKAMRITGIVVLIWTILLGTSAGGAQRTAASAEEHIRRLEQAEVAALLRNDIAAVRRYWASDYVVNNPFNVVVDASKGPIRAGTLTYSSFVREVERVLVRGNTIIVMGHETVVPSGSSPDAGKTIHRRYTNIWMKRGGRWLLTARHASVVCEPEAPPN
jgi:ketosteroid isomerase-like protein